MSQLFNYTTFSTTFDTNYRSMTVSFREEYIYITQEMLYELETLTSWLSNHLEINSVVFTAEKEHFLQGINTKELTNFDNPKLQKFLRRIRKISTSLLYLPQTIIADFKHRAQGIGLELFLTADIKIMHHHGKICFNQLQKGLSPCCGGIGIASLLFPENTLRNWILSGIDITANQLEQNGFILGQYRDPILLVSILESISNQAPVQRIQSKRAFLERIRQQLELADQQDHDYAQAGIITQDWKAQLECRDFINAKEFAKFLAQQSPSNTTEKAANLG